MAVFDSDTDDADLQASLEQLIAARVRRTESAQAAATQALREVLGEALGEIEAQQQQLAALSQRIRAVLEREPDAAAPDTDVIEPSSAEAAASATISAVPVPEDVSPARPLVDPSALDLDVIAHGASFVHAADLQSMLRALPAVTTVRTRQYVNGELRLNLEMASALDIGALQTWLNEHDGRLSTTTDRVIEIEFGTS